MTYAVVPAAGFSTRMGRPKLGLPLGSSTVLAHVVTALKSGGIDVVLVVLGPHVPELVPVAESLGAESYPLSLPTLDMRATVQEGLQRLADCHHPRSDDRWLLVPGDCPAFSLSTVSRLLAVQGEAIIVPTTAGRRGHPVRFMWRHVADILALPPEMGIDSFVRTHPVVELAVDDPGVLCDVDTPEEYERLRLNPP